MIINYIFVLSGGLSNSGDIHTFVRHRLDKAVELYKTIDNSIIVVLSGGTSHKPPLLDSNGYVIHESTVCAKYLNSRGVLSEHLLREWASYDTIGNGYFAFLNYVNPLDISSFTVITSQFHIDRTKVIFDYFNSLICQSSKTINYISTDNFNIRSDDLALRINKENNSTDMFIENIVNKIFTLTQFTTWFYTKHNIYKSLAVHESDSSLLSTY